VKLECSLVGSGAICTKPCQKCGFEGGYVCFLLSQYGMDKCVDWPK